MTSPYVMGIDGGGSRLRVAVLARDLTILGESQGPTASPVVAGPDAAAETIRAGMRAALAAAGLRPEQIAAVGIGIAGALPRYSEGWLRGGGGRCAARRARRAQHRLRDRAGRRAWRAARRPGAVRHRLAGLRGQRGGRVGAGRRVGLPH
ncbi:MAG: hypothetical protein M5U29_13630 [Anaerolineae bacterium]|nr:hypothetical protein [Anaerolineae bacterium]